MSPSCGEPLKELMAEQTVRQRTKQLPSIEARSLRPSSLQQGSTNTSKLRRHTSSSETRLVTRETKRKSLEMVQPFTTDLVRRAIKSCRNSKAFGLDKPLMLADNREATLHAIHTDAVNKAVKDQKNNIVLDDLPHPINDSEKKYLTSYKCATIAQLRSGYCRLLGSHKSRIKKDASLNVCDDCGNTPNNVKHVFACPAHPTTLIASDL